MRGEWVGSFGVFSFLSFSSASQVLKVMGTGLYIHVYVVWKGVFYFYSVGGDRMVDGEWNTLDCVRTV